MSETVVGVETPQSAATGRRLPRAIGAVVLLSLLAAAGHLVVRANFDRERDDRARIEAELDIARTVLADSARQNLLALAVAEFEAASAAIKRGDAQLADGEVAIAEASSRAAIELARAARDLALTRLPVARAATIEAVKNTVLYRAAEVVAWSDARPGMNLFDRDRLATKGRSEAIVVFREANRMRLEENSVLVVERLVESTVDPRVSMTLSVQAGSVRSVVARDGVSDVTLRFALPKAEVVVDTQSLSGGRAEIAVRVRPDESNSVAVYQGAADVVSPSGERLQIGENQVVDVAADGKVSAVRSLPGETLPTLPARDATVFTSSQRPEVRFRWTSSGECKEYGLEVALDERFLEKSLDERPAQNRFHYRNLAPGRYYWRVCCFDEGDVQGHYSPVAAFELVRDDDAPTLAVVEPADNELVEGGSVEARCRTERGASVFINGEEALRSAGGEFTRLVSLQPGVNTLVFEAVDAAGNVMYHSRLVTRRR